MKQLYLILLMTILSSLAVGQNSKPTSQSNSSLSFDNYLTGVKFAEVLTTPEQESFMINNPSSAIVYLGVVKYLNRRLI